MKVEDFKLQVLGLGLKVWGRVVTQAVAWGKTKRCFCARRLKHGRGVCVRFVEVPEGCVSANVLKHNVRAGYLGEGAVLRVQNASRGREGKEVARRA